MIMANSKFQTTWPEVRKQLSLKMVPMDFTKNLKSWKLIRRSYWKVKSMSGAAQEMYEPGSKLTSGISDYTSAVGSRFKKCRNRKSAFRS